MRAYPWTSVAVAAVCALATSARTATIDLPTDEYFCYVSSASKLPAQPKFVAVDYSAKDQFEPLPFRNFTAAKVKNHCNPVTNPSAPGGNPAVHLVEYGIKDSKLHPNASKFVAPGTAFNLVDRFGMWQVTIVKPASVLVRSGKNCDTPGGPCPVVPVPFPSNLVGTADYTCYKVKAPKAAIAAGLLGDQFAQPDSYTFAKITEVCAPTNKGNAGSLGPNPGATASPVHLICYGGLKSTGPKFVPHHVQDGDPMILPGNGAFLDAKKRSQVCVPALKAPAPNMPSLPTPTLLTTETAPPGGVCGALTTNTAGEGVPGRLDPTNPTVDPNAVCTGPGVPKACCGSPNHCDESTSVTCGSLTFGGGGTAILQAGAESATSGGSRTRYSLSCTGPLATCTIGGDAGNPPAGIQCSLTGCASVAPVDTATPAKICAISRLGAAASGTLDLQSGALNLGTNTSTTVHILTTTSFATHGCPRCRVTTSTGSAEVFATGPSTPGAGMCDTDSSNPGAACLVFEPAGPGQGLSADCVPVAAGTANISITTNAAPGTFSLLQPTGHFCAGQGGNFDCTGPGAPNPCCSGPGAGSCGNYDGCFGSGKFADTPALCTGISVSGTQAGFLYAGESALLGTSGAISCIPAVGGAFGGLVNGGVGLPAPVVSSTKLLLTVQ